MWQDFSKVGTPNRFTFLLVRYDAFNFYLESNISALCQIGVMYFQKERKLILLGESLPCTLLKILKSFLHFMVKKVEKKA